MKRLPKALSFTLVAQLMAAQRFAAERATALEKLPPANSKKP